MNDHEVAYEGLRMMLHRLGIYHARATFDDNGREFHFMRLGEFDYIDKWKERGWEQEQRGKEKDS